MLQANLTVAPNGRIGIPANMRTELGCQNGGKILARLIDGVIILEPIGAAIARAQTMVNHYIPQNAALADELIAEHHTAAKNE